MVNANNNLPQSPGQGHLELIPPKANWEDRATYVSADVIDENNPARHDPVKLALAVSEAYKKHRGKRRRLPRLRRNLGSTPLSSNRSERNNGSGA